VTTYRHERSRINNCHAIRQSRRRNQQARAIEMSITIEDAFFFDVRRTSRLARSQAGTLPHLSHLSREDMEDELEELRWQPEATQPVSWDSETSVLVHSAINGIENTLRVRQTRSDQTLLSLASMGKLLKLLHRGKGDRQERKRSVSFDSVKSLPVSSSETLCTTSDAASICAARKSRRNNVFRLRRTSDSGLPYLFARSV